MTPERVARLRELERAATAGPWVHYGDHLVWPSNSGPAANDPVLATGDAHDDYEAGEFPNAALIAALRNDATALLDAAWQETQPWRNDCYAAGHPDMEDCWEHDPTLQREAGLALRVAVEGLADDFEAMGWEGPQYAARLRTLLAATHPDAGTDEGRA